MSSALFPALSICESGPFHAFPWSSLTDKDAPLLPATTTAIRQFPPWAGFGRFDFHLLKKENGLPSAASTLLCTSVGTTPVPVELEIVITSPALTPWFAEGSCATAVNVWLPFAIVVLSKEIE